MRGLLFTLVFAMFFIGCSSKNLDPYAHAKAKKSFETIMNLNVTCQPCDKIGYQTIINGRSYVSDVAVNCCKDRLKIDAKTGLIKVYLHRVADLRQSQKAIFIDGRSYTLNTNLDALFYLSLEEELKSMGIMVVQKQTSPYTLKVDFDFTDFKGVYDPAQGNLNSRLQGILSIKNINYTKNFQISTTQSVKGLKDSVDLSIYTDLIVKQAANKVAQEISKF